MSRNISSKQRPQSVGGMFQAEGIAYAKAWLRKTAMVCLGNSEFMREC